MNSFIIFFYFVAIIIALVSGTDYCSSTLCGKGDKHIACDNDGKFADSCSDAKMVTLTDSLKQVLVDAHNAKRNFIAGGGDPNHDPACRMATMQWDDELAAIAAYNVKQCKMQHDKCRNTDAFKYSGQNLVWVSYYDYPNDAERLKLYVDIWFSEVKNSNRTIMASYPIGYKGPMIGHFTVMMADRNIRLGCAASTYAVTGVSYKVYLLACNYATTNVLGFPIYVSSKKPGECCATGHNPKYPNLCSVSEEYSVNKFY
ncbi:antigen 5 like allergen Cul n 1-like [Lucilia sericata]|uniref:antigen 5 like allergen Cul n 1-like n=1 Tax=Lucilia sericata TaxID=13632 RepID=UPI0018A81FF1|nr:antigen 5 like allergen Cul n 1-like [Lucilia sericata]